tara:strand:+ start:208 stop:618 length:411 start_codon:yes stop_codon:yes gene_type:complete
MQPYKMISNERSVVKGVHTLLLTIQSHDGDTVELAQSDIANSLLLDDNLVRIQTKDNNRFIIETTLSNSDSNTHVSCSGSHGGEQDACETCAHDKIDINSGVPVIHIDTINCELSKHYYKKPYWFQQRLIPSITIN